MTPARDDTVSVSVPDETTPSAHAAAGPAAVAGRTATAVLDSSLCVLEAAGTALFASTALPGERRGRPLRELVPGLDWAVLEPRLTAALAGDHVSFSYRPQDDRCLIVVGVVPVSLDGAVRSLAVTVHEIETGSDAGLRETERMIAVGSWQMRPEDGSITYSPGAAQLLGLDPGGTFSLEAFTEIVHPDDRGAVQHGLEACMRDGAALAECRIVRPDGRVAQLTIRGHAVHDGSGRIVALRGALLDVTEQRRADLERRTATALFEQAFDAAPIGMALTDPVDGRYLRVNDAMCVLLSRSREELTRLAVPDVSHPDDLAATREVLESLRQGTTREYHAEKRYVCGDGRIVWAAVHVGPVLRADGTIEALITQKIDITSKKKQEAALGQYVRDAEWLARIRDALDENRFVLYWQPIVDLDTGETVQRELLLRMRDETGGIIAPGEFLPVAERYGLIAEIDRWVIREAVRLSREGPVEFNLSAASMGDPEVIAELRSAIRATGADPSRLVVEVTETALMAHPEQARTFARELTSLGCRLALDDFGTGFASLSYLKHLPAQHLKIDREFVCDLSQSEASVRLVRGIVGLAREFHQITVAEGIEDEQTLAEVRRLGVDRGQGYLFARPEPIADIAPPVPVARSQVRPSIDPVATVRAAFAAAATGDLEELHRLFSRDLVLRPITGRRARRETPYRGHAGLEEYFRDAAAVWQELRVEATSFWNADDTVIVFGRAHTRAAGVPQVVEVMWIYRLRGTQIVSVDVFQRPDA